jgi:ATP-binding cassette subfamily C (CFTR/MRP) protein 1
MVGLINNRSLTLLDGEYDEFKAVTLMSTDTANVCDKALLIYEVWAAAISLLIGLALLARQVGWVCFMPLLFVGGEFYF